MSKVLDLDESRLDHLWGAHDTPSESAIISTITKEITNATSGVITDCSISCTGNKLYVSIRDLGGNVIRTNSVQLPKSVNSLTIDETGLHLYTIDTTYDISIQDIRNILFKNGIVNCVDGVLSLRTKSTSSIVFTQSDNNLEANLNLDPQSDLDLSITDSGLSGAVRLGNDGSHIKFQSVTIQEYNEIEPLSNTLYIISDSPLLFFNKQRYGNPFYDYISYISDIREVNGQLVITKGQSSKQTVIEFPDADESTSGYMSSSDYRLLREHAKSIDGLHEQIEQVISDTKSTNYSLSLDQADTEVSISLLYKEQIIGTVTLPEDNVLINSDTYIMRSRSDLGDVGDVILQLETRDNTIHEVNLSKALKITFNDSSTIKFDSISRNISASATINPQSWLTVVDSGIDLQMHIAIDESTLAIYNDKCRMECTLPEFITGIDFVTKDSLGLKIVTNKSSSYIPFSLLASKYIDSNPDNLLSATDSGYLVLRKWEDDTVVRVKQINELPDNLTRGTIYFDSRNNLIWLNDTYYGFVKKDQHIPASFKFNGDKLEVAFTDSSVESIDMDFASDTNSGIISSDTFNKILTLYHEVFNNTVTGMVYRGKNVSVENRVLQLDLSDIDSVLESLKLSSLTPCIITEQGEYQTIRLLYNSSLIENESGQLGLSATALEYIDNQNLINAYKRIIIPDEHIISVTDNGVQTKLNGALSVDKNNIVLKLIGANNVEISKSEVTLPDFVCNISIDNKELLFNHWTGASESVSLSSYVLYEDFTNGFTVIDNQIQVCTDAESEDFLSVSEGGLKLSGIQSAIDKSRTEITTTGTVLRINETVETPNKVFTIDDSNVADKADIALLREAKIDNITTTTLDIQKNTDRENVTYSIDCTTAISDLRDDLESKIKEMWNWKIID